MDRVLCVDCFVSQEQYIPLSDYLHQVYLFVLQESYFSVIFKKSNYGDDLLAIQIPYLSTCDQMRGMYYDLVEPSNHSATRDGVLMWGCPERYIPTWSPEVTAKVHSYANAVCLPGPTGSLAGKIIDGTQGHTTNRTFT